MKKYLKPLPLFIEETRNYWEGCKAEKLLVQKCRACGTYQTYPRLVCHKCLSGDLEWVESTGRGTIYSFSVVYRPYLEEFDADVPYAVAIIDLEEGVRMMANVIDCTPDEIRIGMKVEVVFDHVTPEISLPKFKLVRAG